MKKTTYTWAYAALLTLARFSLPVVTDIWQAVKNTMTVTATLPGADSRLVLTEEEGVMMKVDWSSSGEAFTVMDGVGTPYGVADGLTPEIIFNQTEGNEFTGPELDPNNKPYYAYYPVVNFAENYVPLNYYSFNPSVFPFCDYRNQNGNIQDAKLPMYAVSQDGKNFEFQHLSAVLKFNLKGITAAPTDDELEFVFHKREGIPLLRTLDFTNGVTDKFRDVSQLIRVLDEHVTVAADGTCSFYLYLPPMEQGESFDLYCKKTPAGGGDTQWYSLQVTMQKAVEAGKYYSITRTMQEQATFLNVVFYSEFMEGIQQVLGGCTDLKFIANSDDTSGTPFTASVYGAPVYTKVVDNCLEVHTSAPEFCFYDSNMEYMFYSMNLTSLDISSFNTSRVTSMKEMFYGCSTLSSLTLGGRFNTANVTDMSQMFAYCCSLASLDLSSFNTSRVTSMKEMFYGCSILSSLTLGGRFNTANVTDMSQMFAYCSSLASLDLSSFDTAKVTDMGGMFQCCFSLASLDLSSFTFNDKGNYQNMFGNLGHYHANAYIYVNPDAYDFLTSLNDGNYKDYLSLRNATLIDK